VWLDALILGDVLGFHILVELDFFLFFLLLLLLLLLLKEAASFPGLYLVY